MKFLSSLNGFEFMDFDLRLLWGVAVVEGFVESFFYVFFLGKPLGWWVVEDIRFDFYRKPRGLFSAESLRFVFSRKP